MWLLLGTTITTSFFDSLNPSAIAQQMLLQAMVKKKAAYLVFYGACMVFCRARAAGRASARVCGCSFGYRPVMPFCAGISANRAVSVM